MGQLAHDLPFRLRTLQALLRPDGQALIDALGIEIGEVGVLSVIGQNPGISQNDVATAVVLKKSAVTKIVSGLEERGLVARQRVSQDRRVNALTLTTDGAALLDRIRAATRDLNDDLFEGIPDEKRLAFFDIIDKVSDRLSRGNGTRGNAA